MIWYAVKQINKTKSINTYDYNKNLQMNRILVLYNLLWVNMPSNK